MRVYYQGAIAEAGGIKSLVDLIFKWSAGGDGVLVWVLVFHIIFGLLMNTYELSKFCLHEARVSFL